MSLCSHPNVYFAELIFIIAPFEVLTDQPCFCGSMHVLYVCMRVYVCLLIISPLQVQTERPCVSRGVFLYVCLCVLYMYRKEEYSCLAYAFCTCIQSRTYIHTYRTYIHTYIPAFCTCTQSRTYIHTYQAPKRAILVYVVHIHTQSCICMHTLIHTRRRKEQRRADATSKASHNENPQQR